MSRMLASDLSPVAGGGGAVPSIHISSLGWGRGFRTWSMLSALTVLHLPPPSPDPFLAPFPLLFLYHHLSCSDQRLLVSQGEGELSEGSFCTKEVESSAPLLTGWMASPPKSKRLSLSNWKMGATTSLFLLHRSCEDGLGMGVRGLYLITEALPR